MATMGRDRDPWGWGQPDFRGLPIASSWGLWAKGVAMGVALWLDMEQGGWVTPFLDKVRRG